MCNANKIDVELSRVEFMIECTNELTRDEIRQLLSKNVKSLFDQRMFDIDDIEHDVEYYMGIDISHEYIVHIML